MARINHTAHLSSETTKKTVAGIHHTGNIGKETSIIAVAASLAIVGTNASCESTAAGSGAIAAIAAKLSAGLVAR